MKSAVDGKAVLVRMTSQRSVVVADSGTNLGSMTVET